MGEYIGFIHEKRAKEVGLEIKDMIRPHAIAGSKLTSDEYAIFNKDYHSEEVKKYETNPDFVKVTLVD